MGPASRFSLGGLPSQVAHHAPIDILVVRTAHPARQHPYRRILIATDGSLTAHQATRHGYALAEAVGAEVTLIYVGDELIGDIVLRDTAARFDGEAIDRIVTKGNPAVEISKEAGSHDLVVVGNKGMTGSRRYIQRVVPNRVAHEARIRRAHREDGEPFLLRPPPRGRRRDRNRMERRWRHISTTTGPPTRSRLAVLTWVASSTGTAGPGPGTAPATVPGSNTPA